MVISPENRKCMSFRMYELENGQVTLADEYTDSYCGSSVLRPIHNYSFYDSTETYRDITVRIAPGKDAMYIAVTDNDYKRYPLNVDSYSPIYIYNDILSYKNNSFELDFGYENHAAPISGYQYYERLSDGSYQDQWSDETNTPGDVSLFSDEYKADRKDKEGISPDLISRDDTYYSDIQARTYME